MYGRPPHNHYLKPHFSTRAPVQYLGSPEGCQCFFFRPQMHKQQLPPLWPVT